MRNARYFSNVAADLFLGSSSGNIILEGNPWKWDANVWNLKNNFEVNSDLPSIMTWESNLRAASHNLCFCHRGERQSNIVLESQNNVLSLSLNKDDFSKLRNGFPYTPHLVFIAEALRSVMKSLEKQIYVRHPHFKGSVNYINNGISFRYIINQLANNTGEFHDLTVFLLYSLPSKCNDLLEQVSNINDVIRSICEKMPLIKRRIHYIIMYDSEFDASQESYISSQESISNFITLYIILTLTIISHLHGIFPLL